MGVWAQRKSTQSRARESRTLQDAIIVRMEAYIEFEEATTSKAVNDVKSSEARGVLTRLPGGAGRPNHDDVKSFEAKE